VIDGDVICDGTIAPDLITTRSSLVLLPNANLHFTIDGSPGTETNRHLIIFRDLALNGELRISVGGTPPTNTELEYVLVEGAVISSAFSNVAFGERLLTTDRLRSFRIESDGTSIIATDYQNEDEDGDGLRDGWAVDHFGFTPLVPGTDLEELDGDWDGDGQTNRDEFVVGTDPKDIESSLQLEIEHMNDGEMVLVFPFSFKNRYSIGTSDDLVIWSDLTIENLWFRKDSVASWRVKDNGDQRFHRLKVN
jgi:hypothetical protein